MNVSFQDVVSRDIHRMRSGQISTDHVEWDIWEDCLNFVRLMCNNYLELVSHCNN